jgi:hypothetical protein
VSYAGSPLARLEHEDARGQCGEGLVREAREIVDEVGDGGERGDEQEQAGPDAHPRVKREELHA